MQTSPQRLPDHWLFVLFCTLIVYAPLPVGSNRIWASALLQFLVSLMAAGIAWQLAYGRITVTSSLRAGWPLLAAFFAIPLWSALQLLPVLPPDGHAVSIDANATLNKLQKSICYGLLFFSALQLLNTSRRLRTAAFVILFSGLFQASYAVLAALGGKAFDLLNIHSNFSGIARGTFINRNHLAGYLEMCLAVGIGLLIANMKKGGTDNQTWRQQARSILRTLLGDTARIRLFLVAMVIALVMTRSRMGNAAFFASMGLSAGIGWLLFRQHSRSMVILFASMIVIDVFIVSSWFGLEQLANRIEQTDTTVEARLDVNASALPWLKDHWLAGSGAGTFVSAYPAYRTADVTVFFDFAHNDYLQLLGEYGIIGGIMFGAIAVSVLWNAIQAQRQRRTPLLRGMGFASLMGVTSLLIHSSTDFNLHIPANAALFTILCAFAVLARHLETRKRPRHRRATQTTTA